MQFVNIHLYVCVRIWGYIFMLLALFAIRITITLILLLLVMPDCRLFFHLFYFHMTQNELLAWTTKLSGRCQLKRRVAFMLRAYVEVSARAVWIFRFFFTRLAEKQMTSNSRNILRFYVVASKRSFFYLNIWIYTFLCT